MPVDFPSSKIVVEKDQYVLCPPQLWIDQAIEKGVNQQTFIYYTAQMVESGESHSTVKTLSGRTETIPNGMLIPIKRNEQVKKRDIVLTWWQTGSGMNRAIVVGGTATEPVVKYLDIKWDNPTGIAQQDHKLKADTFHKLTEEFQPGTAVMIKSGSQFKYGKLLAANDEKIMVKSQFGKLQVHDKNVCTPIPIDIKVAVGETVFFPLFDKMTEATVTKVDQPNGRVHVKYQFGGKEKSLAVAVGDIARRLPE